MTRERAHSIATAVLRNPEISEGVHLAIADAIMDQIEKESAVNEKQRLVNLLSNILTLDWDKMTIEELHAIHALVGV
jgi:hypothetical protein